MSEDKDTQQDTLVERWIRDQQEWQKTAMAYFDSMVDNEEFLTHLGNAMRGSLLAGKPYPGTNAAAEAEATAETADDRIDEILHALHQIQGELADLKMTVDELKRGADARTGEAVADRIDLTRHRAPAGGSRRGPD